MFQKHIRLHPLYRTSGKKQTPYNGRSYTGNFYNGHFGWYTKHGGRYKRRPVCETPLYPDMFLTLETRIRAILTVYDKTCFVYWTKWRSRQLVARLFVAVDFVAYFSSQRRFRHSQFCRNVVFIAVDFVATSFSSPSISSPIYFSSPI